MLLDTPNKLSFSEAANTENELGKFELARVSYMRALQNSSSQTSRALINMKISDLEGEKN